MTTATTARQSNTTTLLPKAPTCFGPDANDKPNAFALVTEKIVSYLEKGVRPWTQPWQATCSAGSISRPLRGIGSPYHGINVVILWLSAFERGYSSPYWMTYNQAVDRDGHVRKGEKGTTIFYANRFTKIETDDKGNEKEVEIPYMKQYTVFNCNQIDGLTEEFTKLEPRETQLEPRLANSENFVAKTKAKISYGGNQAFYSPSEDRIQMPPYEAFENREKFYATIFHELTHHTKHPDRLNRSFDSKKFGDNGYAREEIVAELGAAFLCADLGITPEVREDHASYLQSWISVLREDAKAIFQAAAHAERAVTYLQQLQNRE